MEVMETKTAVLFERAEVAIDSGGAGRYRGGVGFRRECASSPTASSITVSKKTTSPPWALEGGGESTPNAMIVLSRHAAGRPVGTRRVPVRAGERFRVVTAGGGGRGDPRRRDRIRVREDVLDGFVSPAAARGLYGLTETRPTEPTPGGPSS